MQELLLKYIDSEGGVTERRISDIQVINQTSLYAYCHIRQERRSFRIERIIRAVDPETGEVINPWQLVDDERIADKRETLQSLTWHIMPAIKVLKYFMQTTRGGRKREVDRVVQFIQESADVTAYSKDEVSEWIKKIWCGDSEYRILLREIPTSLLRRCRTYALLIARGSGRKPIKPEWLERIEKEFSPDSQSSHHAQ